MSAASRCLIVIPARGGSTRFPKKPLAKIAGKTVLERVWRIARSCKLEARVIVATESEEILNFAQSFGAEAVLSSASCPTGSDRAYEVASKITPNAEIVVSMQGDAVLTPPWVIENVFSAMSSDASIQIATPAILLEGIAKDNFLSAKLNGSTTGTTVTFDAKGDALYFSKGVIPNIKPGADADIYRHIGMYAYRREILKKYSALSQGKLEKAEGLEQLRALENGIPIRGVIVNYNGRTHASIDNPEDIALVESIIEREGELVAW